MTMSRPRPRAGASPDPSPWRTPGLRGTVRLVSADPGLVDRVVGLAAAAGVDLVCGSDAPTETGALELLLVGADRIAELVPVLEGQGGSMTSVGASRRAARRPGRGVVVVAQGEVAPQVWRQAVTLGADHVAVLPEADQWLLDRLLDVGSGEPEAVVVAVVGGRGGAGASTLAAALSVTAATEGIEPVLVDLDPWGGGLDLVLGAEDLPGLHWEDLSGLRGRLQPGLLTTGLPQVCGVRLLTWSREVDPVLPVAALRPVLDAAVRESDLVVLDLPRRLDEPAAGVLGAADEVVLVVPAEVRATAAAGRLAGELRPLCRRLRLVVRGPAPTGLTATAVADALGLPLLGEVRAEPGLAAALDRGVAPPVRARSPLALLCRRLATELRAA